MQGGTAKVARGGIGVDPIGNLLDGAARRHQVGEVDQHLAVEIAEGDPTVFGDVQYLFLAGDQRQIGIERQGEWPAHLAPHVGVFDVDRGLFHRWLQLKVHVGHLLPGGGVDRVQEPGRPEALLAFEPVEDLARQLHHVQRHHPARVGAAPRQGDGRSAGVERARNLQPGFGVLQPLPGKLLVDEIFQELALLMQLLEGRQRLGLVLLVAQ